MLALCLAAVVAAVGFVWPQLGKQVGMGHTPTPGEIQTSVFKSLPPGLQ